jgi:hypothetical protein
MNIKAFLLVLTFLKEAVVSGLIQTLQYGENTMRYRSFLTTGPLLFVGPTSLFAADVTGRPADVVITINCDTNEETTAGVRVRVAELFATAKPLQELRVEKKLDEEQNALLLELQTQTAEQLAFLSIYEFWQFYCDNPKLMKEQAPPPVDPESVA